MDEDLKIVLSSELEADEQASAQRISAQLPNIAKLINAKSRIKVGVSLDDASLQTQTQKLSSQLQSFSSKSKFSMKLDFGSDKVEEMKQKLRELNVPDSAIKNFVDGIDKGLVGITQIRTAFSEVGDNAKTVTATVEGITSAGERLRQTISQGFTWDDESNQWTEGVRRSTTDAIQNYEQLAQAEEKATAAAKKANETRVSSLIKLESQLDSVKAKYSDINAPGAIKNQASLGALKDKYDEIFGTITRLKNETGKLSLVDSAEIQKQITELENLAKAYKNLESAGTKLRKKDISAIKVDQAAGLDKLETQLKNAGILTKGFQKGIAGLRGELSSISDASGIRKFLDDLDALKGSASALQEKMRGVNDVIKQIAENEAAQRKIRESLNVANISGDPNAGAEQRARLEGRLAELQNEHAELEKQRASYGWLVQASSQLKAQEQERLNAEIELTARAQRIADTMDITKLRVEELRQKYSQLAHPTEDITNRIKQLETLQNAVNNATSDQEKVAAYERLNAAIDDCKESLTILNRMQGGEVRDYAFTQNLEKAKADLADVGRKWSALKKDPGLNKQFRDLEISLQKVDNQMDLKKWRAEFSKFQAQVRAAGKNMQSFGDILKNNISKVAQWGLSTVSIYGVLSKLKSAVNIVLELDTAMIDLRKTTNETEATYRKFYQTANETAKNLGVTTREVISQTAEWSRLGLSMQSAAKMAENSAIFKAISPELSAEEATDGLISIMKAYNLEADEMLDGVISKINKVGKYYCRAA